MRTWELWTLHLSAFTVSLSGILYFIMKDLLQQEDPFSLVNHPWQPFMLALHLVSAPFLILILGIIYTSHIEKKLRSGSRANRRSGLLILACIPVMILSGYLLQVAVDPGWLWFFKMVHLISSGFFVLLYGVHLLISLRLARRLREGGEQGNHLVQTLTGAP